SIKANYDDTVDIKYKDVKDCYFGFPFDFKQANETIESLKGIYNNFFVYLDQSKEKAQDGFSFTPIDLIAELDALLNKNYNNEFEFFSNITQIIVDLKDAHTTFKPSCYNAFTFRQTIRLYSSVDTNVYSDNQDPSNNGCEVTHIDGYPALKAIINYADKYIRKSRDPGVRFNMALTSLKLKNSNNGTFDIYDGDFAYNSRFPDAENIAYDLNCSNTIKKIKRSWIITHNENLNKKIKDFYNFTDSKSYYESICLKPKIVPTNNFKGDLFGLPTSYLKLENSEITITGDIIGNVSNFATFIKLNETGVVVIPTFEPESFFVNSNSLLTQLTTLFDLMNKSGVKKVVFDFINNGGGYILLSQYFNELIFPQSRVAFPRDMKINDVTTFLLKQSDNLNLQLPNFSPKLELSYTTGVPFNNLDEFIGNKSFMRGSITTKYSSLFNEIFDITFFANWKFPWTNKDIIILTNGACGSSCAQTAQYLSEQAKIATVSVGGLFNSNMSYSSFPGGNVVLIDNLFNEINQIINTTTDHPKIPKNLNITMYSFGLSFSEAYSIEFPNLISEFMYRPANYRLYYDDKCIYDPSLLWLQAAKFIS
ncbi:16828_t:CDS:2, partial [Cetraspora pellucida]